MNPVDKITAYQSTDIPRDVSKAAPMRQKLGPKVYAAVYRILNSSKVPSWGLGDAYTTQSCAACRRLRGHGAAKRIQTP